MSYYEDFSIFLCFICLLLNNGNCTSNTNFNANIRDYSVSGNISNSTNVKTLQKEDKGRYANFAPIKNPQAFKEIPDNVLSSSSHSRGLLHHEVPGYVIGDYEEIPHYGQGYDYHIYDHHDPHTYKHHYDHHDSGYHHGHQLNYGHQYKHYNHALATKTLLWPIAGIALLGAAAALVNNPVLLQLGVVSGRRKRQTEEISTVPNFKMLTNKYDTDKSNEGDNEVFKKIMNKLNMFKEIKYHVPTNTRSETSTTQNFKIVPNFNENDDERFIPVPLKFKNYGIK